MIQGILSKSIINDSLFTTNLLDSAKKLFNNEKLITLYNKDDIVLKGILTSHYDLDFAYYVKLEKDLYSVYVSLVPCYIETKEKSNEYILSQTFSYGGIKQDEKLTTYNVEKLITYDETIFKNIDDIIHRKNYTIVPKITNSLVSLKKYLYFIFSMGININKTDNELMEYVSDTCSAYQENIYDLGLKLEFIQSLKDKFTQENMFEYNDLDNYIWNQEGYIFIEDQNVIFICDFKDRDNFTVYPLIKDLFPNNIASDVYINSRFEKIKSKDINIIDDCGIIVNNKKLLYISEIDFYIFELDVFSGVECIQEEYGQHYMKNSGIDIDITTVKYIRDYFYTVYNYNRFNFCSHVFLTLGTEFDYDSILGSYKSNSISYRTDIKECPLECEPNKNLYGPFNDYIKISYLTDDWKEELKWFYNKIEELPKDIKTIDDRHGIQEVLESIEPFTR